jgi:hypothetical protein
MDRDALARHFHRLVQMPRTAIFGSAESACRPINLPEDAETMFAGYVGTRFAQGRGVLLLGINPGGGADRYVQRTAEDEEFYPLLAQFKAASLAEVAASFERINSAFVRIVQHWNLWKIVQPTLVAAGQGIDGVAYMNVVPYRTRNDKMPPIAACKQAWARIGEPSIAMLQPRAIVALGKKAGSIVEACDVKGCRTYCVPRTIGDSYVSEAASAVHDRMRAELRE